MLYRATQDGCVMVERSDRMWSTGEGNSKLLQYSCHQNPMNIMKRQKYMTPEDGPSGSEGVQYTTGEEQRVITNINSFRKNEAAGPKQR